MALPSVVYIVGAGTSKKAGAPLMDNFFSKAQKIMEDHKGDSIIQERFGRVFKYRQENLPLSNIESLFSYLETISSITKGPKENEIKEDFVYLISKVLDITLEECNYTDHTNFMNKLGNNASITATIISLNYDILFDRTYASLDSSKRQVGGSEINYGCDYTRFQGYNGVFHNVSPATPKGVLKLLKLHGSLNWLYCSKHDKLFVTTDEKIAHKIIEQHLTKKFICDECKRPLEPLIIPPSLTKMSLVRNSEKMRLIWDKAFRDLVGANKVVIFGYSFPETDTHFKLFLQGALQRNLTENNNTIILEIVSREKFGRDKVDFEDKHKDIFAGLGEMVKLSFRYAPFGSYVP